VIGVGCAFVVSPIELAPSYGDVNVRATALDVLGYGDTVVRARSIAGLMAHHLMLALPCARELG
jgi:hypothetical protein